ncbi:MAG: GntR family transcriptional regulator [Actinobacteria bacterium]|nr:GntR family transcriptional regulator [Actinomycetota bacterium]
MSDFTQYRIKHDTLSEKAYHMIKSLIINNELKPGEKIIQEKMAEQLGISKIPLIQALTLLNNEGLLDKVSRKGFYVRKFSRVELNQIFEIRSLLEMLSVSTITKNIDSEIEKKLKDFLKDFETFYLKRNDKKYYDVDVKFHHYLIEASENKLLKNIIENFNILIICYTRGFVLAIDESFRQHKELIEAMLNRDVKKAENAIREHIQKISEKFNSLNN